jgi:hypothetical protein
LRDLTASRFRREGRPEVSMEERLLSEVEQVNFTILCLIRDVARADIPEAITRFNLTRKELQQLCDLCLEDVLAIVYAAGNELLFQPRHNLLDLLKVPASLLSVMLSAQSREVSTTDTALV